MERDKLTLVASNVTRLDPTYYRKGNAMTKQNGKKNGKNAVNPVQPQLPTGTKTDQTEGARQTRWHGAKRTAVLAWYGFYCTFNGKAMDLAGATYAAVTLFPGCNAASVSKTAQCQAMGVGHRVALHLLNMARKPKGQEWPAGKPLYPTPIPGLTVQHADGGSTTYAALPKTAQAEFLALVEKCPTDFRNSVASSSPRRNKSGIVGFTVS